MIIENPCYHCYTGAVGDIYCTCCKYHKETWSCDLESRLIEVLDTSYNEKFRCFCVADMGAKEEAENDEDNN